MVLTRIPITKTSHITQPDEISPKVIKMSYTITGQNNIKMQLIASMLYTKHVTKYQNIYWILVGGIWQQQSQLISNLIFLMIFFEFSLQNAWPEFHFNINFLQFLWNCYLRKYGPRSAGQYHIHYKPAYNSFNSYM